MVMMMVVMMMMVMVMIGCGHLLEGINWMGWGKEMIL
jgi:hypothetical protein